MKSSCVNIQINATEQNCLVVLIITPYTIVLTFESMDGMSRCDH